MRRVLGSYTWANGQVALARVDALDANEVAVVRRHCQDAQIAELAAGVGLVQALADERRPPARRAVLPAAPERADALAKQDRCEIGHGGIFERRIEIPAICAQKVNLRVELRPSGKG
jgi:hypothetical protein